MTPEEKLARMLLWFEEHLPEHDLSVEVLVIETHELTEPEREQRIAGVRYVSMGRVPGMGSKHAVGTCRRCGVRFEYRNGTTISWAMENRESVIAEATGNLERDAARTKCWGDVPAPERHSDIVAVLDSAREPDGTHKVCAEEREAVK